MLSHLSIVSVMLLPKFVVTAYLALQSQRTTSEDYGSVQQIQSPLQDGDAASVGEYVIEINGEPIVKEHVDIMVRVFYVGPSAN